MFISVVFVSICLTSVAFALSEDSYTDIEKSINNLLHLISLRHQFDCGTWMNEYTRKHPLLITGTTEKKPRIIVAVPNFSGLADRIVGIASVFAFGFITDRAIQVGNRPKLVRLETAFYGPNVNWTRPDDPEWIIDPLKHKASIKNYNQSVLESKQYFAVNTLDDYRLQDRFLRQDINKILGEETVNAMICINRGKTIRLHENEYHRDMLKKVGLTPHNTFGCLVNYLLQPLPSIFIPVLPQLKAFQDMNTVIIGIQIRTGDWALNPRTYGHANPDEFLAYFTCAQSLTDYVKSERGAEKVLWYFVTDMFELRGEVMKRFGDRIITSLDAHIEHTSNENCRACKSVSHTGFQTAAAEWWLLGACDYHIISKNSGFGRSAGMRSLRMNSIYTISQPRSAMRCTNTSFTDLENLSYDWSGI